MVTADPLRRFASFMLNRCVHVLHWQSGTATLHQHGMTGDVA